MPRPNGPPPWLEMTYTDPSVPTVMSVAPPAIVLHDPFA